MSVSLIHFVKGDLPFPLNKKVPFKRHLLKVIGMETYILEDLSVISCSDEYLLKINRGYLQHDDYTDVITFDNSDAPKTVSGDIFISFERIKDNATSLKIPFDQELSRVIIHGLLHLLGYKDKTPKTKKTMTEKEDFYLALLKNN